MSTSKKSYIFLLCVINSGKLVVLKFPGGPCWPGAGTFPNLLVSTWALEVLFGSGLG